MLILSHLPAHIIAAIIGVRDTSYVVIKLWLCGSFQLNTKLSKGLTYLDLDCHQFGSFKLPRMIFQLTNLRHLSISSPSLTTCNSEWPKIMRSLPQNLEFLSVLNNWKSGHHKIENGADLDCIWNWDSDGIHKIETDFPRGKSCAIDFASLFPRLHTLHVLSTRPCLSSDLFPALPTSLTYLDASIELCYGVPLSQRKEPRLTNDNDLRFQMRSDAAELAHLSKLPPNIAHLSSIECSWYSFDGLDGFELMQRDFAENSPASLQSIVEPTIEAVADGFDVCWLPKSVLEVDWTPFRSWTPAFARTMPPNLQTLRICNIDKDSYINTHTNWVADLPRTLTSFYYLKYDDDDSDFASFAHSLPPNLTELTIHCDEPSSFPFKLGDWSTISADHWPLKLKSLELEGYSIELQDVRNLPPTLETLTLRVEASASTNEQTKPILHLAVLPPKLTNLNLEWNDSVSICFETTNITLTRCSLSFEGRKEEYVTSETLALFPPSLTSLICRRIGFRNLVEPTKTLPDMLLPNLKRLRADHATVDWLPFAPRSLQTLCFNILTDVTKSPLLATGQLFKHLPPTLTHLDVNFSGRDRLSLPPQEFRHLPLLTYLRLGSNMEMPSSTLRLLPRTLRHLKINITKWNYNDLPDLPPHLYTCRFPEYTLKIVEHMSLRSLVVIWRPKPPILQLVESRVKQAAVEQ